jgi:hypothetical protein
MSEYFGLCCGEPYIKNQWWLQQQQQHLLEHCALLTTLLLLLSKHLQPLAVLALILHQKWALHSILQLRKVCAWWVSKMLTFNQKVQHVAVSAAKHLHQFVLEVKMFLE